MKFKIGERYIYYAYFNSKPSVVVCEITDCCNNYIAVKYLQVIKKGYPCDNVGHEHKVYSKFYEDFVILKGQEAPEEMCSY